MSPVAVSLGCLLIIGLLVLVVGRLLYDSKWDCDHDLRRLHRSIKKWEEVNK